LDIAPLAAVQVDLACSLMHPGNLRAARHRLLPSLALALLVIAPIALNAGGIIDFRHLAANREFLLAEAARLGSAAPVLYALL
jgi:hypothetical protein